MVDPQRELLSPTHDRALALAGKGGYELSAWRASEFRRLAASTESGVTVAK